MAVQTNSEAMRANKAPFSMALLHPRHFSSWLVLLFAALLSLLPQRQRHWLGVKIGDYLFRNHKKRRDVVLINLKQAFPQLTEVQLMQMAKEHLGWYGKALVDYSVFFFGSKRRLQQQVSIMGEALLVEVQRQQQPLILLLAHSVMLEFAVVALSANHRSFGSYKTSSDPVLDWMIAKSRCRYADFVVSRDEGLRPLMRAIKSQRIMIFLPDEDLGLDNATFVPFFGRQKATLTTPARLSRLGGAKAIAGFVAFDEGSKQYQLRLLPMPDAYPEGEAAVDALALNNALETLILQRPEQYMWIMKWFRTPAPENERIY